MGLSLASTCLHLGTAWVEMSSGAIDLGVASLEGALDDARDVVVIVDAVGRPTFVRRP